MIPIRMANPLIMMYLKSYENHSADFLNDENFVRSFALVYSERDTSKGF